MAHAIGGLGGADVLKVVEEARWLGATWGRVEVRVEKDFGVDDRGDGLGNPEGAEVAVKGVLGIQTDGVFLEFLEASLAVTRGAVDDGFGGFGDGVEERILLVGLTKADGLDGESAEEIGVGPGVMSLTRVWTAYA